MDSTTQKTKSWLALGDSYTIGEQVPLHESFPYQTLQLLRNAGLSFYAPEIVAKTGWTTDELNEQLNHAKFLTGYDMVTLLIGVNNQFRGRNWYEYKLEFMHLLHKAIGFASGRSENVYVLSIPDWGVTPFAKDRETERIAMEIDKYNEQCKLVTEELGCHYLDITGSQRVDGSNTAFLATDGLHPSGQEYAKWAKTLFEAITNKAIAINLPV
ncbi:MAG: SGNH/GDSL hydrolase family protein [Chitinophagaceae bacterium]|nr:MAG: SGNH/GDSL hydrolase family protein [Chitinophagaceae bacterium]